jgi:hypothetical protein
LQSPPTSTRPESLGRGASAVAWVAPDELDEVNIHPTMRRQLDTYLAGASPKIN